MKDWKYYNHAMLPTLAPHEKINESVINSKMIWKHKRKPLLVRWTSEFDCGTETDWWYCIKDTPFQLCELKAKRRYEITKGNRNFNVVKINVCDFKEELYRGADRGCKRISGILSC